MGTWGNLGVEWWFRTISLIFALQHQSLWQDCLCHNGVGTDATSVKAAKFLWHLEMFSPQENSGKKQINTYRKKFGSFFF